MKNLVLSLFVILMFGTICQGTEKLEKIDVFEDCLGKLKPGTELKGKKVWKLSKDSAKVKATVKMNGKVTEANGKKLLETKFYIPAIFIFKPAPENGFKINIACKAREKSSICVIAFKGLPMGKAKLLTRFGGERQIKSGEEKDLILELVADKCKGIDKMIIMVYNLGRKEMVLQKLNITFLTEDKK